jgi:Zn-dependent membrane protease YugP
MLGIGMGYWIIAGLTTLVGSLVSNRLQSKFNHYSQFGLSNGMSGREVAEAMLRHYGIFDVTVQPSQGFLTDHYNPADKTVNLSETVYNGRSIAAAAVAAHECGHAVQHATAYSMLRFRSAMVPALKIANGLQQFLFIAGMGMMVGVGSGMGRTMMLVAIFALGVTTLFSLVTLPVEFDASRRALVWLDSTNTTRGAEHEGAKDALKWAAMTYVAAALSSLAMLVYYVLQFMGSRED